MALTLTYQIIIIIYFTGYVILLWQVGRMIVRKCKDEPPPESYVKLRGLFVIAVIVWPLSLAIILVLTLMILIYLIVMSLLICTGRIDIVSGGNDIANRGIGDKIFRPKLVKRLYLKFWNSGKGHQQVCSICLDPFTHTTDSVNPKGGHRVMNEERILETAQSVSAPTSNPNTTSCKTSLKYDSQMQNSVSGIGGPQLKHDKTNVAPSVIESSQQYADRVDIIPLSVHHTNEEPQSTTDSPIVLVQNTSSVSVEGNISNVSPTYDVISECSNRVINLYNDDTCVTSCGHCFHYSCLLEALKRRTTCPDCRQIIHLAECCAIYRSHTDYNEEPRLIYSCRPVSGESSSRTVP